MKSSIVGSLGVLLVVALPTFHLAAAEPAKPVPYKNIGPDEFEKLSRETKHVILDVRTAEEFAAGHIAGAVNMDITDADFAVKVAKLDKERTYLVHCASGGRSRTACEKLHTLAFPRLFNLSGGIRAWEKAGKPVEKQR